jgi:hypothetical protein
MVSKQYSIGIYKGVKINIYQSMLCPPIAERISVRNQKLNASLNVEGLLKSEMEE